MRQFDAHSQELLHGSVIAFGLKVIGAGLAFGLNVLLARLLGAEGSGAFFLSFTIVLVVATAGMVGMGNTLVRFIAANTAIQQAGKVLGVYQKAMFYSLLMAAVFSLLLYLFTPWMSRILFAKPELDQPLSVMSIAVIPLALLTLHASALQGLKKIAASILILGINVPLLTGIISILLVPDYGIKAAAWGYLLATIITLLLGRWFWKRAIRSFKDSVANFSTKELLASSMPLFGVTMLTMIINWSPMLFFGLWESSASIGIYSAASRTAMLTSFVLVAVNSIAAPKFAALYQQNDLNALSSIARNATAVMMLAAFPILLLFILIPESILSVFGEQFRQGAGVLMILAIGQFVNVSTGASGHLLIMSGHERLMRNNLLFCASCAILLNLLLIPEHGIQGGAIVTAFVLAMLEVLSAVFVWKKLNIIVLPWVNVTQKRN